MMVDFTSVISDTRMRASRLTACSRPLGKEGFDALMQSLGLAAWHGGGRTDDGATYAKIRETFMPQSLEAKAKQCNVTGLDNVALLFHTQKDETTGQGYEFLHKSFGEYLHDGKTPAQTLPDKACCVGEKTIWCDQIPFC